MNDIPPFLPSKTVATIFVEVCSRAFLLGLLGVFLLPKEETMLRKVALGMSYFFGLPLVVGGGLEVLRKTGIWNGK